MRGLIKLTAIANNIEARKDFRKLADEAIAAGNAELVEKHRPPESAGWRVIDKHIGRLRKELERRSRRRCSHRLK